MVVSKFSLTLILSVLSIYAVDAAHIHVHTAAPSPSPSFSSMGDCTFLFINMADCLSFVSSGSQVSKPEGNCCSALKTVLDTNGECLCEAFKTSASLGVPLSLTKAFTLPALCKISASSVPKCALSLTPAGAPGGQPSTSAGAPEMVSRGGRVMLPPPASSGSGRLPLLSVTMGSLVIAVLARNSEGHCVGACTYPMEDVVDAFVAEARACERAMVFVAKMGFKRILVEGDSLTTIKKLNSAGVDRSVLSPIINNIRVLED
ncbi:hypothetical protein J1N35_043212 [Gossypium stocksii]|uniref:Bifunctional inhibitor/plant lipid transfer protein/seed storage helical domain-containing protein n=1 Tax=Gossypium stocksii TaxID=47602 RepID=A0A9D3U6Z8_9ROSI|nr:hypothetical protein J1N35_043212 [Gossypium stocksii]